MITQMIENKMFPVINDNSCYRGKFSVINNSGYRGRIFPVIDSFGNRGRLCGVINDNSGDKEQNVFSHT